MSDAKKTTATGPLAMCTERRFEVVGSGGHPASLVVFQDGTGKVTSVELRTDGSRMTLPVQLVRQVHELVERLDGKP